MKFYFIIYLSILTILLIEDKKWPETGIGEGQVFPNTEATAFERQYSFYHDHHQLSTFEEAVLENDLKFTTIIILKHQRDN